VFLNDGKKILNFIVAHRNPLFRERAIIGSLNPEELDELSKNRKNDLKIILEDCVKRMKIKCDTNSTLGLVKPLSRLSPSTL
jgi:hypothetical protein